MLSWWLHKKRLYRRYRLSQGRQVAKKNYPDKSKVVKSSLQLFQEAKLEKARRIREAMRETSLQIKAERKNTSSA